MDWSSFDPFTVVRKKQKKRYRSPYLKRCAKCGQSHSLNKDDPCPFAGVLQYHRTKMLSKPNGLPTSHNRKGYVKPCCHCGNYHLGKEQRDAWTMCNVCQEYHVAGKCPPCRICGQEGCNTPRCTMCVMCKQDHGTTVCESYCIRCGHFPHKGQCECMNCQQSGHSTTQCQFACRNCHQDGHLVMDCPVINKCKHCGLVGHRFDQCALASSPCSNCGCLGHNVEMCFAPCIVCQSNNHVNFQCMQEYRKTIHRETRKINRKINSHNDYDDDAPDLVPQHMPFMMPTFLGFTPPPPLFMRPPYFAIPHYDKSNVPLFPSSTTMFTI